jgi:hypothetical protein
LYLHLEQNHSLQFQGSNGYTFSNNSSELLVVRWPGTSRLKAVLQSLARLASSFPLRDSRDDEDDDLDESLRETVREIRRHENEKRNSQHSKASGGVVTKYDRARSTSEEHSLRKTSAMGSEGLNEPRPSNIRKSERSGSDASENSYDSAQSFDAVHSLPRASVQARMLTHLGIDFREEPNEFTLTEGLDRSRLSHILRASQKLETLVELREITSDNFTAMEERWDETGQKVRALTQPLANEVVQPSSRELVPVGRNVFDESVIYGACASMTSEAFRVKLSSWKSEMIHHASIQKRYAGGFSAKSDTPAFCKLLGCTELEDLDPNTGKSKSIDLVPFECFVKLQNGLRLMLVASKSKGGSDALQNAVDKLTASIFNSTTIFHETLRHAADLVPKAFLNSMLRSFAQLFDTLGRLEMYELTVEEVHELGSPTGVGNPADTMKHMATAVLLATTALMELEGHSRALEAEVVRRKVSLINESSEEFYRLDYDRVKECCSKILSDIIPTGDGDKTEVHRQKRYHESIDHLVQLGWDRGAAMTIVRNECRWERATYHANLAGQKIEASFQAALRTDPAKRIQWKAAALPTDLVALLISRVLWRPVFDGQDALDMYNQYTSDLVSTHQQRTYTDIHTDFHQGVKYLDRRIQSRTA